MAVTTDSFYHMHGWTEDLHDGIKKVAALMNVEADWMHFDAKWFHLIGGVFYVGAGSMNVTTDGMNVLYDWMNVMEGLIGFVSEKDLVEAIARRGFFTTNVRNMVRANVDSRFNVEGMVLL